jgi:uncharacterized protein YceH (UPF0502 family)
MPASSVRLPVLSLAETRVLGVLIEKERTVADTYPLSLNALVAGCNQKSNREPVLELSEAQVQAALDRLRQLSLAIESSGARVARYAHNVGRVLKVSSEAEALLAALFLRGAQTAGELRIGAERLHRFADIPAAEAVLEALASRPEEEGGALVAKLPRRPAEREPRWAHLLSGPAEQETTQAAAPRGAISTPEGELGVLREEVAALREEVRALRVELLALKAGRP